MLTLTQKDYASQHLVEQCFGIPGDEAAGKVVATVRGTNTGDMQIQ